VRIVKKLREMQLNMFGPTPEQVKLQRRILTHLIELKYQDIEAREFKNFFGTTEQILKKVELVEQKKKHYRNQVSRAFPHVPLEDE